MCQMVCPAVLRKLVLREVYDGRVSGHLVTTRTLHRIKSRLYWPGVIRDVENWCNKCERCAQSKPRPGPKHQPMGHAPVGDRMEIIVLYIMDPGVRSSAGNRYIMILVDTFTKWTEAYASRDHTAQTVADALVTRFICRFGVPSVIHTNCGREFESNLMK